MEACLQLFLGRFWDFRCRIKDLKQLERCGILLRKNHRNPTHSTRTTEWRRQHNNEWHKELINTQRRREMKLKINHNYGHQLQNKT